MKIWAAGLLVSASLLCSAAMAQDWDGPPPPGAVYNFYGPSTNYFGPAPDDGASGPGYGDAGAYGPAAYGAPGYDDWAPGMAPPDYYEDMRQDPWHGYDPDY